MSLHTPEPNNPVTLENQTVENGIRCHGCRQIHRVRLVDRAGFQYCFKLKSWCLDLALDGGPDIVAPLPHERLNR